MRILFATLFISHNFLFAQISDENSTLIDSLSFYVDGDLKQLDLLKRLGYNLIIENQDSAIYYSMIGLERAKNVNEKKYAGAFHQRIGIAYRVKGEFLPAIEHYKQAENQYSEIDDQTGLAGVYNSLGIIFSITKNYALAIPYFEKLILMDQKEKNYVGLVQTYSNLAGIYTENKKLDLAADCYQKTLDLVDKYQIYAFRETLWDNIGSLQLLQNNLDSAFFCYERSLYFNGNKNPKSKMHSLLGLGQVLERKGEPLAEEYLKEALELSKKIGDRRVFADINLALARVYKNQQEFNKAYTHLSEYSMLKDTLLATEQIQQVNELEIRYETEKKELQLEIEKKRNFYSYVIAGFLFIILFLVINRFLAQRKINRIRKEKLEREVDYKNRLLASRTLDLANYSRVLEDLNVKIDDAAKSSNGSLTDSLKRTINQKLRDTNDWSQVKLHFEEVHPDFFDKMEQLNPPLTANEQKHCAYIKMKLDNKEIARMLNVNLSSVHVVHHRLKKKLKLSESDSLPQYINKI